MDGILYDVSIGTLVLNIKPSLLHSKASARLSQILAKTLLKAVDTTFGSVSNTQFKTLYETTPAVGLGLLQTSLNKVTEWENNDMSLNATKTKHLQLNFTKNGTYMWIIFHTILY